MTKNENLVQKTATGLQVMPDHSLMISGYDPAELSEIMDDIASDITMFDLTRFRFPTGDGLRFTADSGESEKGKIESFEGIIVGNKSIRAYYDGPFKGNGRPPNCSSYDGIVGHGDPGGHCVTCPLSKFGSSETGDGAACKAMSAAFILLPDSLLPAVIIIPVMSVRPFKRYRLALGGKGVNPSHAVTRFSLSTAKNGSGIEYPQLVCRATAKLSADDIDAVNRFKEMFAPLWARVIESTDFSEVAENPEEFNPDE